MNIYNYECMVVIILIPIGILLLRNRCRKAPIRETVTEPQAESKTAIPPIKPASPEVQLVPKPIRESRHVSGIPSFERPSDIHGQPELFSGKWVDDGSADGAYCREEKVPFLVVLEQKLAKSRKERGTNRAQLGLRLTSHSSPAAFHRAWENHLANCKRLGKRAHPFSVNFVEDVPPGTPHFPESSSKSAEKPVKQTQPELDWL